MISSVAQKLEVQRREQVYVVGTPEQFALLGPLPDKATTTDDPARAAVALLFVADATELETLLAEGLDRFRDVRASWIAYPAGRSSDIDRDTIRARVAQAGWRLDADVAIDDTWSAVRMTRG